MPGSLLGLEPWPGQRRSHTCARLHCQWPGGPVACQGHQSRGRTIRAQTPGSRAPTVAIGGVTVVHVPPFKTVATTVPLATGKAHYQVHGVAAAPGHHRDLNGNFQVQVASGRIPRRFCPSYPRQVRT